MKLSSKIVIQPMFYEVPDNIWTYEYRRERCVTEHAVHQNVIQHTLPSYFITSLDSKYTWSHDQTSGLQSHHDVSLYTTEYLFTTTYTWVYGSSTWRDRGEKPLTCYRNYGLTRIYCTTEIILYSMSQTRISWFDIALWIESLNII
jgi:hypothetical protein